MVAVTALHGRQQAGGRVCAQQLHELAYGSVDSSTQMATTAGVLPQPRGLEEASKCAQHAHSTQSTRMRLKQNTVVVDNFTSGHSAWLQLGMLSHDASCVADVCACSPPTEGLDVEAS